MNYDLSLEIPEGTFFEQLKDCWKNLDCEILKGTKIVDTYETDKFHSMTIRFDFASHTRTLSSGEVQEIMDKIIANLGEIGVKLRG